MENNNAVAIFSALAQPTRLDAFRLIMGAGREGLPAGEVARQLGVPQNTMSTHLAILSRAGLIGSERQSRSILYRAELETVQALAGFLINDCCGGRPELCEPAAAAICCAPEVPSGMADRSRS